MRKTIYFLIIFIFINIPAHAQLSEPTSYGTGYKIFGKYIDCMGYSCMQNGTVLVGVANESYSYYIWTDGILIYAKNGTTGKIDFEGINFNDAMNYTISNCVSTSCDIAIQGSYNNLLPILISAQDIDIHGFGVYTNLSFIGDGFVLNDTRSLSWTSSNVPTVRISKFTINNMGNTPSGVGINMSSTSWAGGSAGYLIHDINLRNWDTGIFINGEYRGVSKEISQVYVNSGNNGMILNGTGSGRQVYTWLFTDVSINNMQKDGIQVNGGLVVDTDFIKPSIQNIGNCAFHLNGATRLRVYSAFIEKTSAPAICSNLTDASNLEILFIGGEIDTDASPQIALNQTKESQFIGLHMEDSTGLSHPLPFYLGQYSRNITLEGIQINDAALELSPIWIIDEANGTNLKNIPGVQERSQTFPSIPIHVSAKIGDIYTNSSTGYICRYNGTSWNFYNDTAGC